MTPPTPAIPADEDVSILLSALRGIADINECYGNDGDDEHGCSCTGCRARYAIGQVGRWRFEAALAERVTNGFNPAEARMVASFRAYMESGGQEPDVRLGQVLRVHPHDVTRRDWYVAVSVVQWLATNIGSTIIEGAGYKYMKLEEDRALREAHLPTTLLPPPPVACPEHGADCDGPTCCCADKHPVTP